LTTGAAENKPTDSGRSRGLLWPEGN